MSKITTIDQTARTLIEWNLGTVPLKEHVQAMAKLWLMLPDIERFLKSEEIQDGAAQSTATAVLYTRLHEGLTALKESSKC